MKAFCYIIYTTPWCNGNIIDFDSIVPSSNLGGVIGWLRQQEDNKLHKMEIKMTIKEKIEILNKQIAQARLEHDTIVGVLRAKINEIRKTCPHINTTYHPDPSGNNDSCYTCDECGLEKKRFKNDKRRI